MHLNSAAGPYHAHTRRRHHRCAPVFPFSTCRAHTFRLLRTRFDWCSSHSAKFKHPASCLQVYAQLGGGAKRPVAASVLTASALVQRKHVALEHEIERSPSCLCFFMHHNTGNVAAALLRHRTVLEATIDSNSTCWRFHSSMPQKK